MMLFVCSTLYYLVSEKIIFFYGPVLSSTTGFSMLWTPAGPGEIYGLLLRIVLNSFKKYIGFKGNYIGKIKNILKTLSDDLSNDYF